MEQITEREKKLIEIVQILLNLATIQAFVHSRVRETMNWGAEAATKTGVSVEWQNEVLKFLNSEFGIKYSKLDENMNVIEEQE